jgi:DNA-binding transcriptional ArsR family regulator
MSNAAAAGSELPEGAPCEKRPATLQEIRALAHPLRLRILRLCLDKARTNSELAALLGQKPATMLYHVRTLVRTGFLAEEPSRPGPRGTVEKPYLATGRSWHLDGSAADESVMLRVMFEAVAAEVDEAGPEAILESARMALRLRPDQLADFRAQIRTLIKQFPSSMEYFRADAPGTEPYALMLVLHRRHVPVDVTP